MAFPAVFGNCRKIRAALDCPFQNVANSPATDFVIDEVPKGRSVEELVLVYPHVPRDEEIIEKELDGHIMATFHMLEIFLFFRYANSQQVAIISKR